MLHDAKKTARLEYPKNLAGQGSPVRRDDVMVDTHGSDQSHAGIVAGQPIRSGLVADLEITGFLEHLLGQVTPPDTAEMGLAPPEESPLATPDVEPALARHLKP